MKIADLDATAQAELVRSGEVRPIELVDAAIEVIKRVDPQLDAVLHRTFDYAREQATTIDESAPFPGALYESSNGLPLGVQLAAGRMQDELLLGLAYDLEEALPRAG